MYVFRFRSKCIYPQNFHLSIYNIYLIIYIIYNYICYHIPPPSDSELLTFSMWYERKIPFLYKIYQVYKVPSHLLWPLCFMSTQRGWQVFSLPRIALPPF